MRFLALLIFLIPSIGFAQGFATLIADNMSIDAEQRLIAHGNIEVFFDGTKLSATEIVYDGENDRLLITGPILIQTPNGDILTADSASLDPKLQNGLLRGARLVLQQQLQLAANQIDQIEGRYTQLYKTAVTSCAICGDRPPLWDIRAERVVHDQSEQQLYFENATFRIRGLPILFLPRARLPDPTLTRATGFLIPNLRTTDQLGSGLKTPYFIRLGDHRDLTITPYLSNRTTTLEARYRQAFLSGDLEINSAVSNDTIRPEITRGYLFAEGNFKLGHDYQLNFDIEAVSDPGYLLDYGYATKDRLDSAFSITRVGENDLFVSSLTYYRSLREGESNSALPPLVADVNYERRVQPKLGGILTLTASADTIARYGSGSGSANRDVARVGTSAHWRNQWINGSGLVFSTNAGVRLDHYQMNDDPSFGEPVTRLIPHGGITFSYPMQKLSNTATHFLEPIVALAWSDQLGGTPPNEDSTRPELDHGNLFAVSRFPGDDSVETGLRGAIGVKWTRSGNSGAKTNLTFGRVFREDANSAFHMGSGLSGTQSDWLVAGQMILKEGIRFEGRSLFGDNLQPTLASANLNWQNQSLDLTAQYLWQASNADFGTSGISEWSFDTSYQINDIWKVSFDTRYDIVADQAAHAGLGIEWRNECVTANLSVSRRFTSSTNVEPSTDFGLSVALNGFSAGRSNVGPATQCTN